MNKMYLISISILINSLAQAEPGKCIALGRVAGEDKVCAQYNNTDQETCRNADGHARCAWETLKSTPPNPIQQNSAKAPLYIKCIKDNGQTEIVNVMSVLFNSKPTHAIGLNFGPNRGDEGFYELSGECEITLDPTYKGLIK